MCSSTASLVAGIEEAKTMREKQAATAGISRGCRETIHSFVLPFFSQHHLDGGWYMYVCVSSRERLGEGPVCE